MEQETTKLSVEECYEALKKQFISLTNQLMESEAKREGLEKKLKLLESLASFVK